MPVNVHYLELFYYVAKHQGISEAVRHMPYGIQQPAVSSQMLQLEDHFGGPLFTRRPFALTPAGEKLFAFIEPFFSGLNPLEEELREGATRLIRIGASSVVLRDHLPDLLNHLRKKFPRLKFNLRDGLQPQIEEWLLNQQIDFGFTVVEGKPPAGIQCHPLMELPLILLVHRRESLQSAEELWTAERIPRTLISLPPNETISRRFQQGLAKRKIVWPVGIEVSSLELMESYVTHGFGVAVTVRLPNWKPARQIRVLSLKEFKPVTVGALWFGKLTPITQALLNEAQERALALAP